ncbi:MAG: M28 family peptidase [Desulfurococcales archaeon]|nr:M28 family peptidase [Desulfurococcales archaeon]
MPESVALKAAGNVNPYRAMRILKQLTLYNRIQGTVGLDDAAYMIESYILEKAPIDVDIETDIIKYTPKTIEDLDVTPPYWSLAEAEVEARGIRLTSRRHPTLAAPHTPPSDGWVPGELVEIADPLDRASYQNLEGKIPLVYSHYRIAYRLAAEAGAAAIAFARRDLPPDAVPYIGLFISHDEAKKYGIPAVSLPRRVAETAAGSEIRVRVDADVGEPRRIPVVAAWAGSKSEPGPVLIAHYCHPEPGANDNASGVAAAIEAFLAAAEAGIGNLRLVLVPEYTGSIPSARGWLRGIASAALNLDMVGGGSEAGPMRIYYPSFEVNGIAGDLVVYASHLTGIGLGVSPYRPGSDHDSMIAYGVSASMINQWPDPFYHSDMDDVNRISPQSIYRAAVVAAAWAALSSSGNIEAPSYKSLVVDLVKAQHVASGDLEAYKLAKLHFERKSVAVEWKPVDDERILEPRVPFPVDTGSIARRSIDAAIKIARLDHDGAFTRDLFYVASKRPTVKFAHSRLAALHGTVRMSEHNITAALDALAEAGLISLK